MTKIASLSVAGALLALGFSAAPAQAGPNRTWVSGKGTDAGACPVTTPCRTFAFALTQTAAGGEIDVLDPAGYGTITIAKSISIVNDGVGTAAIGSTTGNAITINAGPGDSVILRGLTIEGIGSAGNGILFNTGGNLAIENCVIRGFAFEGINIAPSTSSSFSVSNTIASNNSGSVGIVVRPTGSAVVKGACSAKSRRTTLAMESKWMARGRPGHRSMSSSSIARLPTTPMKAGVSSDPVHAATAAMLRNVVASYNNTGLLAGTNAILRVAHSVVTGNGTGVLKVGGGILDSYGDNDIDGNTSNGSPTTTIPTH